MTGSRSDDLHGISSPEDQRVAGNGDKESAKLRALIGCVRTTVEDKVPNNENVGDASNGVPSPLLWSSLRAERGKEAGQNHDQIGSDGHKDVGTGHASQKTKVEKKQRSGDCPVDITGPVDLTVNMLECIGNMIMLMADGNLVHGNTMSSSHRKVRKGGSNGNQGCDDMVQALSLWDC